MFFSNIERQFLAINLSKIYYKFQGNIDKNIRHYNPNKLDFNLQFQRPIINI